MKEISMLKTVYANIPKELKRKWDKNIYDGHRGDFLYVYYDVDTISNIANLTNEVWFKKAQSFSDKEEYSGWANKYFYVSIELDQKKYESNFKSIVKEAFNSYDIEKYNNRFYIFCSSYKSDNNLCWNTFMGKTIAHVNQIVVKGNNYNKKETNDGLRIDGNDLTVEVTKQYSNGACICLHRDAFDNLFDFQGFICYDLKILSKKFFNYLKLIYKRYKQNDSKESIIGQIHNLIDLCNLFYKDEYYAGEKEYRYVIDKNKHDIKDQHYLEMKRYRVDEEKIIYKFIDGAIDHITVTHSEDKSRFNSQRVHLSRISFNEEDFDKVNHDILYED
jgi:hypothetical protein